GADRVVPPLVADLVRHQAVHEVAGDVRHGHDALVDHDQAAALVAVPAEVRFDHREVGEGRGAEPAAVDGDGLTGDAHQFTTVELVTVEGEAVHAHRTGLARELLEAGAAKQGEVAGGAGRDVDLLPAVAEVLRGHHRPGGGQLLAAGQRDAGAVNAGLVEE